MKIGSLGETPLSCDIVDTDALIGTVIWQFRDNMTQEIGSLTIPLAKGCPFVTTEVFNMGACVQCSFDCTLEMLENNTIYVIGIDENSGYLLILPRPMTLTLKENIVNIPKFTGAFQVAFFDSEDVMNVLINHAGIYPIESTVDNSVTLSNDGIWQVQTTFSWATAELTSGDDSNLLLLALPSHQITNLQTASNPQSHPVLSPYRFVTTDDDTWVLTTTVRNFGLAYPPLTSADDRNILIPVWQTEINNILAFEPTETVEWMRWIGSIAQLIMMGSMLNQDISFPLSVVINRLTTLRSNNGQIAHGNQILYDTEWGGTIGQLGATDCSGSSDEGNAFYRNHIGQFGYLVYAYAVAGSLNPDFIAQNKTTALFFARNVANPCSGDPAFPLWRNHDWYYGYSLTSGLEPGQTRGKESKNSGSTIFGYYACYLLGTVTSETALTEWSLAQLSWNISANQHYFQFAGLNSIEVNPAFVQGTINERGDTYYAYTVNNGNADFPARNASMMVPIMKPVSVISFASLNGPWALQTQSWMAAAIADPEIEDESLSYALGLRAVNADAATRNQIITTIQNKAGELLPYGSTWSSILYWTLSL